MSNIEKQLNLIYDRKLKEYSHNNEVITHCLDQVINIAHSEASKLKLKAKARDSSSMEMMMAMLGTDNADPFGREFHQSKYA